MKIRSRWLIRLGAWLLSVFLRMLIGTLRYRYQPMGPNLDPHQLTGTERYIYAFWHENMLLLPSHYCRKNIHILVSQHADGEIIASMARYMGGSVVRGSTSRGGMLAVRRMLELGRDDHLAVATDGPRGPRRRVHEGLIYLAARTGLPIVLIGIGYSRPWRFNSWDRFALPKPFTRARTVTSEPIAVPADANKAELEMMRRRVEAELLRLGDLAEEWAGTGEWPAESGDQSQREAG